jgi:hypothetical protein
MDDQDSSSAYVRNVGSNAVGSSSGTYSYDKVYNGSEVVTGTMYGNFASYYGWVEDLSGNLEDFTNFGGGEQLRYLAPLIPTPGEVAPASFATPPQNLTFTAPPSSGLQPPGPVEGGEEEPGTLGTVWHYAWEYGGEFVPLVGSGRGFKRAYDEGSTLGMGLSAVELGLDLSGIGPVARGGKIAIEGTFRGIGKVASEVKPLASAAIDVAKTKAGEAYSFAKSKAGDAATWMSETSDSVVGGLAGAANWMYSGAAGFFGRGRRVAPIKGLPASTNESVNDKLRRYLLDPNHPVGGDKAKWFRKALGFTQENLDDLAKQVKFDPAKAVATELTQHGQKYEQVIEILVPQQNLCK